MSGRCIYLYSFHLRFSPVSDFYPHFSIYDETTNKIEPFKGHYTLKVIGGAERVNEIRRYSNEDIALYNKVGRS